MHSCCTHGDAKLVSISVVQSEVWENETGMTFPQRLGLNAVEVGNATL